MLESDRQVGVQVLMEPPFDLELAFTSGLPHASSSHEVASAAQERASLLLGSEGEQALAKQRLLFQQRSAPVLSHLLKKNKNVFFL
jgi:hypothetical protein